MKKSDVFPSKYLKCEDLAGKPVTVQITSAPLEQLKSPDGKEQNKIVLYFLGAKKTLPLNVSNFDSVADICGEDTDTWPGRTIVLYPAKTQMAGKTVDCVRIRAPQQPETGRPATPVAPAPVVAAAEADAADEMSDEIPF